MSLSGSPPRGCIRLHARGQVSLNMRVAVLPSSGKSRELFCLERRNNWVGSTQRCNILRTPLLKCAIDVITTAPTPRSSARKQPSVATSTPSFASLALDHYFLSAEAKARFSFFLGKDFVVERVRDSIFDDMKITRMLEECSLLYSVDFPTVYYPRLVSEFYSNLHRDVENPESEHFGLVYVRGKFVKFSPFEINRFLQTPNPPTVPPMVDVDFLASTLSDGLYTKWHKEFRCTKMTSLFSFLHKIATFNWKPSVRRSAVTIAQADLIYRIVRGIEFNLGEIVFPCVTRHAEKKLHRALCFPCLISAMCLDQGVEITDIDHPGGKVDKFAINIKPLLNSSIRTIDLPVAFADDPPPATQDDVGAPPPPPVDPVKVLQDQLGFVESEMLVARDHFSYLKSQRRNLITDIASLSGQIGGASTSQDDVGAPPPPVDPVQALQEQLGFVESEMLLARDHFSSFKSQRRNLITAIDSLSGKKVGASTSQVYEDLDPDFQWSTLGHSDNV